MHLTSPLILLSVPSLRPIFRVICPCIATGWRCTFWPSFRSVPVVVGFIFKETWVVVVAILRKEHTPAPCLVGTLPSVRYTATAASIVGTCTWRWRCHIDYVETIFRYLVRSQVVVMLLLSWMLSRVELQQKGRKGSVCKGASRRRRRCLTMTSKNFREWCMLGLFIKWRRWKRSRSRRTSTGDTLRCTLYIIIRWKLLLRKTRYKKTKED